MNTNSSSSSGPAPAIASLDGAVNSTWSRFYDSHYQAYYWYNNVTHESTWEQTEEAIIDPASTSASKRTKQHQIHKEHNRNHLHHKTNLQPRSFNEFQKEFESNPHYFLDPSKKEEDENEQLLPDGKKIKTKNRKFCTEEFFRIR